MSTSIGKIMKRVWNAFQNRDPTYDIGGGSYYRPDRIRLTRGNERSIVTSIFNRIAMDVAAVTIKQVRTDENGQYVSDIVSGLNNCLNLEANIDQSGRAFVHDIVMSMFDEGCVAVVPVETDIDPRNTSSFDILSMRTGKIVDWYPQHVKVNLYNERTGRREDLILPKKMVAVVENPLYSIVNEPNSTVQRLIRKLALLDVTDEQTASGKLDLIIQLPYVIKSEARKQQADARRSEIERQLAGSKYGIAYTDGTERITQLNRSLENNLMSQIQYLTEQVYSQLGINQSVLDGTADEKSMLNYNTRTIEPIVSAITDEFCRKFLTKTARTQKQTIMFFTDPFKLVPVNQLAEIADKFSRNEIVTSNEFRSIIGMKPSDDPRASQLLNKNIKQDSSAPMDPTAQQAAPEDQNGAEEQGGLTQEDYNSAMKDLDDLDSQLDELEKELDDEDEIKHYASPYYDPVKAHEYYMKTRELKGRRSTSGLNEEGRSAAKYVREQLNTERKQKVNSHKEQTNTQVESLREQSKAQIKAYKDSTQNKIDQLREQLKGMSKEQRARVKEQVYGQIDDLRAANKAERQRIQAEYKSASGTLRTTHKEERTRLKDEYDEKYLQELDKIKSEAKFKKKSKR